MVQYELIEGSEPRQVQSKTKVVFLPLQLLCPFEFDSHDGWQWQLENPDLCNFAVNYWDKKLAKKLALKLQRLLEINPNHPGSQRVLDRLMGLKAKSPHDYSAADTWEAGAFALSCYCEDSTSEVVVSRLQTYTGRVLEVFCGHATYFQSNPLRQITAVDGCKKSLLRYPHTSAKKFCCDLDQVAMGLKLEFLEPGSYDLVSICFGYKYPCQIVPLLKEFFRLLKSGGTVSFVESSKHGYAKYMQREFKGPGQLVDELTESGFANASAEEILVNVQKDMNVAQIKTGVFHVTAVKPG